MAGLADYSTRQLAAELTAGHVTADLTNVLSTLNGLMFNGAAMIATNKSPAGTNWTVTDGASTYTLQADANGVLSLVDALSGIAQFSTAQIEAELNAGVLTSDLVQAFKDTGGHVTLSTAATISGRPWTVTDGGTNYTVQLNGGVLQVQGGIITSLTNLAGYRTCIVSSSSKWT